MALSRSMTTTPVPGRSARRPHARQRPARTSQAHTSDATSDQKARGSPGFGPVRVRASGRMIRSASSVANDRPVARSMICVSAPKALPSYRYRVPGGSHDVCDNRWRTVTGALRSMAIANRDTSSSRSRRPSRTSWSTSVEAYGLSPSATAADIPGIPRRVRRDPSSCSRSWSEPTGPWLYSGSRQVSHPVPIAATIPRATSPRRQRP